MTKIEGHDKAATVRCSCGKLWLDHCEELLTQRDLLLGVVQDLMNYATDPNEPATRPNTFLIARAKATLERVMRDDHRNPDNAPDHRFVPCDRCWASIPKGEKLCYICQRHIGLGGEKHG